MQFSYSVLAYFTCGFEKKRKTKPLHIYKRPLNSSFPVISATRTILIFETLLLNKKKKNICQVPTCSASKSKQKGSFSRKNCFSFNLHVEFKNKIHGTVLLKKNSAVIVSALQHVWMLNFAVYDTFPGHFWEEMTHLQMSSRKFIFK